MISYELFLFISICIGVIVGIPLLLWKIRKEKIFEDVFEVDDE